PVIGRPRRDRQPAAWAADARQLGCGALVVRSEDRAEGGSDRVELGIPVRKLLTVALVEVDLQALLLRVAARLGWLVGGAGDAGPLAQRLRPTSLAEFVGQSHVLGEGSALRRAIEEDRVHSSILYGPPGSGKTTLARIVAASTGAAFEELSAVSATVKDVREVL